MWLWRLMYAGAVLGFAIATTTVVFLLWYMVDIGFAWITIVIVVLISLMLFFSVRNRSSFDIRR
jgi:hypothetical protein